VLSELVAAAASPGEGGRDTDADKPIQDGWMSEDR
jgi:hypothetical protein